MDYLLLAKKYIESLASTDNLNVRSEISDRSEIRATSTERSFTRATDPYRGAGGRSFWKMHVPPDQRPEWVRKEYGLD